jgi:hypothetical protein
MLIWGLYFLQLDMQIGFGGHNLQALARVALTGPILWVDKTRLTSLI